MFYTKQDRLRFRGTAVLGKIPWILSLLQLLRISPDPTIYFQLRTPGNKMECARKAMREDHPGLYKPEFGHLPRYSPSSRG